VIITDLIGNVEGGSSLSAAAAKYPKVFNQVYINLLAAGETSGTLDVALERLALQQEKDAEIISKVRGALIYPALVIVVMFAVVGFMLVKVLPQVEIIYKSLPGATLPLVTKIMLDVSHFIIKYWLWALISIGILVVLGSRWARTLGGKRVIDKIKMKSWPIDTLFMKMYMARFARTASTLVASGVPLLQVLEVTSNAVDNIQIADSIHKAIEKVKGGKALSECLRNDPNFLPLVPNMLSVGEQSGSMEEMLNKTADYYEKEVDEEIKNISAIIEPLLMILLGIMAFAIVAAVLLPIYGLANKSFVQT
jgi:type IV pilus assembly protein PilC